MTRSVVPLMSTTIKPMTTTTAGVARSSSETAGADWSVDEQRRTRRAVTAGGVGTLIEYYDFSLYGYLAIVLGPLFFPNQDPVISLLSALAVFGTAYLIRPLGGIVFGHIGDRYGRKTALIATLICMGLGSFAMGLLPVYADIGVWATVLLVAVRLVQGFSAGGEVGGSATFISESTPARLKATYGAFTPAGALAGFALAAAVAGLVSGLTTPEDFRDWGWRIPFLLALPLTLFCLWLRSGVSETQEHGEDTEHSAPLMLLFRQQPLALIQSIGISIGINGTAYIGVSYMSIHLVQRLGYDRTAVYWITSSVIGLSAIAMPFVGMLGDRIGRTKIIAMGLIGFAVITYPAMYAMSTSLTVAAIAFLLIMLNTSFTQVGAYTVLPLLFEKNVRYTGVALAWNLGVIIAGGSAPFAAVWVVETTGNLLAPAYFVALASAVGLLAVYGIRRRSLIADEESRARANPR